MDVMTAQMMAASRVAPRGSWMAMTLAVLMVATMAVWREVPMAGSTVVQKAEHSVDKRVGLKVGMMAAKTAVPMDLSSVVLLVALTVDSTVEQMAASMVVQMAVRTVARTALP
jgi:hypothetical protein